MIALLKIRKIKGIVVFWSGGAGEVFVFFFLGGGGGVTSFIWHNMAVRAE